MVRNCATAVRYKHCVVCQCPAVTPVWCRNAAKALKPGVSAKRTRTARDPMDHPASSLPDSATDDQQPHIPRRKRSRASDQIRPLEVLAAANAAARAAVASRAAYEAHLNQDDYTSDPLSSLAAAAAAESESDAELAKSPEQVKPLHTNRL